MQIYIGNGNQHVSADRDLDLRLGRVLVGAIKRLYLQVLLGAFEKKIDLLALQDLALRGSNSRKSQTIKMHGSPYTHHGRQAATTE
jgi:hypothetical protein